MLAKICIWVYVCKCMCAHMCTLPSCSIIHQLSAAGNRQRFMACDCAMSGFIRTIERKLTAATKDCFCMYLISMRRGRGKDTGRKGKREWKGRRKTERQVMKGRGVEVSLRDHGGLLVFPIFIVWSTEPTLPRSLQLIWNPYKKMRVYWFSLRHACF